jgi:RimJ/RimL family protein N-acetyltransferase
VVERWVEPVTLEGRVVRLEPLAAAHLDGLGAVAFDPDIWRWTTARPTDLEGLRAWLVTALRNRETGLEEPFATIDLASGRPIGSTRFLSIVPEHRRLEIGWTWVAGPWQGRGANREAKYLQLRHSFESLGANRVEFKTDSLNDKANAALRAIGATFEGTFRDHMVMPGGRLRHSNYYSVVVEDWPRVREDLERSLETIATGVR